MSTWILRDVIFFAGIVFNAGGLVWMLLNHVKHSRKGFEDLFDRMRKLEQRVSRIEGRFNGE